MLVVQFIEKTTWFEKVKKFLEAVDVIPEDA